MGRKDHGVAACGSGAQYGMAGRRILAPLGAPPPRLVLHMANILRAAEIRGWERDPAPVRWLPPERGDTGLTVAHFRKGGPVYVDTLPRLGDLPGSLLLMLPTNHGLSVAGEAVANGTLLAFLHWDDTAGCRWDALVPHLNGHHTYMWITRGHPPPGRDVFIAAFHDHGVLPSDTWQEVRQKFISRDYRRHICTRLRELQDCLRQQWDNLGLHRLEPWSPASHLPHTCHLRGAYDTVSSTVLAGTNRCAQCSQMAACPWPEPPPSPRQGTEKEAL